MSFRLAQLSDLHLGVASAKSFHKDPYQQFTLALDAVLNLQPDGIIVTGDISLDTPDDAANEYLKASLDKTGLPYAVLAGNHDNSQQIASTFHPEAGGQREVYYQKRFGDENIIFLDSSQGRFSSKQWDWFRQRMEESTRRTLICMHHPPLYTGSAFMDSYYAFIEQEEFCDIVTKVPHQAYVFCGHYHYAGTVTYKNLHIYIAPSTLFQMRYEASEFQLSSTVPGFRMINISPDRLETTIHWLH